MYGNRLYHYGVKGMTWEYKMSEAEKKRRELERRKKELAEKKKLSTAFDKEDKIYSDGKKLKKYANNKNRKAVIDKYNKKIKALNTKQRNELDKLGKASIRFDNRTGGLKVRSNKSRELSNVVNGRYSSLKNSAKSKMYNEYSKNWIKDIWKKPVSKSNKEYIARRTRKQLRSLGL